MYKLDLEKAEEKKRKEKAEEPEIKQPTPIGSQKKRIPKDFCFIDYTVDCVDDKKLWKTLKEMRMLDHLTCLLRNLYAGQLLLKIATG